MRRHELGDFEWSIIAPLPPNTPRGVKREDGRRALDGVLWRSCAGSPQRDVPERYGPHATCRDRFVRWRKAGILDRRLAAVSAAYDGDIASAQKGDPTITAWTVPAAG